MCYISVIAAVSMVHTCVHHTKADLEMLNFRHCATLDCFISRKIQLPCMDNEVMWLSVVDEHVHTSNSTSTYTVFLVTGMEKVLLK